MESELDSIENLESEVEVEDSVYTDKADLHSEYLYLLFIDLVAFLALFFLAYNSLKKLKIRLEREDDPKFKIVNGLIAANGLRALSLIVVIVLENNSGNSPTAWVNYLAHVVPSLTFVSAYMALIYLLADYYYTLKDETNHIVYPILRIIVVSGYIVIALIALISFASKQFKMFMYSSEFVIGVVYIITSSMIIYYGQLIGNFFLEKYKYETRISTSKIHLITRLVGGLFFLKGVFGLITAFRVFDDIYPTYFGANVWDFMMMLITEISPTFVFVALSSRKPKQTEETPDETELRTYEN